MRAEELVQAAQRGQVEALLRSAVEAANGLLLVDHNGSVGNAPSRLTALAFHAAGEQHTNARRLMRFDQFVPRRHPGVEVEQSPAGMYGITRRQVGRVMTFSWSSVEGRTFGDPEVETPPVQQSMDGRWLFYVPQTGMRRAVVARPMAQHQRRLTTTVNTFLGGFAWNHREQRTPLSYRGLVWAQTVPLRSRQYELSVGNGAYATPVLVLNGGVWWGLSMGGIQDLVGTSPVLARPITAALNRAMQLARRSGGDTVRPFFGHGPAPTGERVPASEREPGSPEDLRRLETERRLNELQAEVRRQQERVALAQRELERFRVPAEVRFDAAIEECIADGILKSAKLTRQSVHLLFDLPPIRWPQRTEHRGRVWEAGMYKLPPAWVTIPNGDPLQMRICFVNGEIHSHPHVQWGTRGLPCWGNDGNVEELRRLFNESPRDLIYYLYGWLMTARNDERAGGGHEGQIVTGAVRIGDLEREA